MEDIYGDLENYDDVNLVNELKTQNAELRHKLGECVSAMDTLQKDFDKLSAEFKILETNYSSLLKIARAEIKRKTDMITNLNIEKDMLFINHSKALGNKRRHSNFYNANAPGRGRTRNNSKAEGPKQINKFDRTECEPPPSETSSTATDKSQRLTIIDNRVIDNVQSSEKNLSKEHEIVKSEVFPDNREDYRDSRLHAGGINSRLATLASYQFSKFSSDEEFEDMYSALEPKTTSMGSIRDEPERGRKRSRDGPQPYKGYYDALEPQQQHPNYNELSRDHYNKNRSRFHANDRNRSRDKYDLSQPHRNKLSPERYRRGRREYVEDRYSQQFDRHRRLESPPRERYQHRSRERRPYPDKERADQKLDHRCNYPDPHTAKSSIHGENDEPQTKRPRIEKYLTPDESRRLNDKQFSYEHHSIDIRNETSCQSPDYLHTDQALCNEPIREIKSTAVTSLDDPRKCSKKYVKCTDGNKDMLCTVSSSKIHLQPVNKSLWNLKKDNQPIPEALSQFSDALVSEIYMDIDTPVSNLTMADNSDDKDVPDCRDVIKNTFSKVAVSNNDLQENVIKDTFTKDAVSKNDLQENVIKDTFTKDAVSKNDLQENVIKDTFTKDAVSKNDLQENVMKDTFTKDAVSKNDLQENVIKDTFTKDAVSKNDLQENVIKDTFTKDAVSKNDLQETLKDNFKGKSVLKQMKEKRRSEGEKVQSTKKCKVLKAKVKEVDKQDNADQPSAIESKKLKKVETNKPSSKNVESNLLHQPSSATSCSKNSELSLEISKLTENKGFPDLKTNSYCKEDSEKNVSNTREFDYKVYSVRHIVEGDLELSDETNDDTHVQSKIAEKLSPEKKQKSKNKSHRRTSREKHSDSEAKTKKTRSKKDKGLSLKRATPKSKLCELFGDSSSLITPEDLELATTEAHATTADNYMPMCEDAQDGIHITDNLNEIAKKSTQNEILKADEYKVLNTTCPTPEPSVVEKIIITKVSKGSKDYHKKRTVHVISSNKEVNELKELPSNDINKQTVSSIEKPTISEGKTVVSGERSEEMLNVIKPAKTPKNDSKKKEPAVSNKKSKSNEDNILITTEAPKETRTSKIHSTSESKKSISTSGNKENASFKDISKEIINNDMPKVFDDTLVPSKNSSLVDCNKANEEKNVNAKLKETVFGTSIEEIPNLVPVTEDPGLVQTVVMSTGTDSTLLKFDTTESHYAQLKALATSTPAKELSTLNNFSQSNDKVASYVNGKTVNGKPPSENETDVPDVRINYYRRRRKVLKK